MKQFIIFLFMSIFLFPYSIYANDNEKAKKLWEEDKKLQQILEEEVSDSLDTAIIWNPQTGRIRAYVYPNNAFRIAYSLGSIFKLFTTYAALNEDVISQDEKILCNGTYKYQDKNYTCWHPQGHGNVNLIKAIALSCNVYFYNLSERLSFNLLYKTAHQFHFGKATGLEEGEKEEKAGKCSHSLENRSLASYSIGDTESLLVTPLQVLVSTSALLNEGYLYRPQITHSLDEIINFQAQIMGNVDLPRNNDIIRRGMLECVQYGTGKEAFIEGINILGKTSTSTIVGGGGHTHGWFVAFTPYEKPSLGLIVFNYYGNGYHTAAPLAGKILYRFLREE